MKAREVLLPEGTKNTNTVLLLTKVDFIIKSILFYLASVFVLHYSIIGLQLHVCTLQIPGLPEPSFFLL